MQATEHVKAIHKRQVGLPCGAFSLPLFEPSTFIFLNLKILRIPIQPKEDRQFR